MCIVTDTRDDTCNDMGHVSRDIAVSNLTAMIARDEYVLEESYSGDDTEETTSESLDDARLFIIFLIFHARLFRNIYIEG